MVGNQLILLLLAFLVPLALFKLKRRDLLLGWVCFSFSVQVFDTVPLTNLPAARVVGLLYLPFAIRKLKDWLAYTPVRLWFVNYGYLLVLGLAFGLLWPWADITLVRPFTLTATGRTLIFSVRLLIDLSLTIFVAEQMLERGNVWRAGRAFVVGASVSSVAALMELVTRFDIYQFITGLDTQVLSIARAHGLAGEPRGLGLVCVYAIMILAIGRRRLLRLWSPLLILNLVGLLLTYSASSFILLCVGLATATLLLSNRVRWLVLGLAVVIGLVVWAGFNFLPQQFEHGLETVTSRLDPERKLSDIPPGTFGQEIAYRLDVFDASATLFLLDNPLYALIGTGPGLVSLPASFYVPPGIYSVIWNPSVGINGLPFHGILLELCNSGLLGLFLLWKQIQLCRLALKRISTSRYRDVEEVEEWNFALAFFLVSAAFYLVQVHSSPIWSLTLGLGWTALRKAATPVPFHYQPIPSFAPNYASLDSSTSQA